MKAPNTVELTSRQVIEHKLLTALEDARTVAILASEQDLKDMIAALYGYKLAERKGDMLVWQAHDQRCKNLTEGLTQLLQEAFPKCKVAPLSDEWVYLKVHKLRRNGLEMHCGKQLGDAKWGVNEWWCDDWNKVTCMMCRKYHHRKPPADEAVKELKEEKYE